MAVAALFAAGATFAAVDLNAVAAIIVAIVGGSGLVALYLARANRDTIVVAAAKDAAAAVRGELAYFREELTATRLEAARLEGELASAKERIGSLEDELRAAYARIAELERRLGDRRRATAPAQYGGRRVTDPPLDARLDDEAPVAELERTVRDEDDTPAA